MILNYVYFSGYSSVELDNQIMTFLILPTILLLACVFQALPGYKIPNGNYLYASSDGENDDGNFGSKIFYDVSFRKSINDNNTHCWTYRHAYFSPHVWNVGLSKDFDSE